MLDETRAGAQQATLARLALEDVCSGAALGDVADYSTTPTLLITSTAGRTEGSRVSANRSRSISGSSRICVSRSCSR